MAIRQANRRHDVVAVQITDRFEAELPSLGRLLLEDAETGEVIEVNTASATHRGRFAQARTQAQSELDRSLRSAGVDAIRLRTGEPYGAALGRFFETRERRRMRG